MTTSTSFLEPCTPGRHSNTAIFLQLRAQRPVAPKRSPSAFEAPSTQHLQTLRLESACSVGRIVSVQELGRPGLRRIGISIHARPGTQLHAVLASTGLRVAPICVGEHRGSDMSSPARVACYLLPDQGSKLANTPIIVTDRTACLLASTLEHDTGKAGLRGSARER